MFTGVGAFVAVVIVVICKISYYMATLQLDCTCTFTLKQTIPHNIVLFYNGKHVIEIIIGKYYVLHLKHNYALKYTNIKRMLD